MKDVPYRVDPIKEVGKKSRRKQFLGGDGGGRVDEFHVVVVLNVLRGQSMKFLFSCIHYSKNIILRRACKKAVSDIGILVAMRVKSRGSLKGSPVFMK